jgi:hypothetical protein
MATGQENRMPDFPIFNEGPMFIRFVPLGGHISTISLPRT